MREPSTNFALVTDEFVKSLQFGFVDRNTESDIRYRPKFVTNNVTEAQSLLQTLETMLKGCTRFDFSVAFITGGGITSLLETLREVRDREIPGRILTTTYNNFNDPDALRKLLEFPNIELRVFQGDFHTKGYLFHNDGYSTIIIGSSNLTQKALKVNKEWNVLLHSLPDGEMLENAKAEFEELWNHPLTAPISEAWIREYEAYRFEPNRPKVQVKPAFVSEETALEVIQAAATTPGSSSSAAAAEAKANAAVASRASVSAAATAQSNKTAHYRRLSRTPCRLAHWWSLQEFTQQGSHARYWFQLPAPAKHISLHSKLSR